MRSNMRIAVLITCHNRRSKTLICLDALFANDLPSGFTLSVILVDDGSTDGTSMAVREKYPRVEVIVGDGSLFWSRGMHLAQAHAMASGAEYLLWLNDDTELLTDAVVRLVETESSLRGLHGQPVIVVGSTFDRETGLRTYGGQVAPKWWKPFYFQPMWHDSNLLECHSMNGNVVLIPQQIAGAVGNLDPAFEHAMGDVDYALRTRAKRFRIVVVPGFVGHCPNNATVGTYMDESLPFRVRWKQMMSRKGLPPQSWARLTRKHCGIVWPIYFVWPYLKLVFSHAQKIGCRTLRR